jgi:hypothetical protein
LALFGRRPPQRVDSLVMPASENLHNKRLMHRSNLTAYSIISSARASSDGETVNPSAFAVLRLTASRYFVGACAGRLAGFSPLKDLDGDDGEEIGAAPVARANEIAFGRGLLREVGATAPRKTPLQPFSAGPPPPGDRPNPHARITQMNITKLYVDSMKRHGRSLNGVAADIADQLAASPELIRQASALLVVLLVIVTDEDSDDIEGQASGLAEALYANM